MNYGRVKRRVWAWMLALAMVLTSVNLPQVSRKAEAATGLPGARSGTNSAGDVFLGGNYIEIGISKHGSFGTKEHPEDSVNNESHTNQAFHDFVNANGGYRGGLGLQSDQDGWNVGEEPTMGDFFLPGSPEERWMLAYKVDGTTKEFIADDRSQNLTGDWDEEPLVRNLSSGDMLKAEVQGQTSDGVVITITYTFDKDDIEYQTDVSIENIGDKDITDARFIRSFDPDQDEQLHSGTYETYNKVICNPISEEKAGAENYCMIVAKGAVTLGGFFFLAVDNRARASILSGLTPSGAYQESLWDSATVTDKHYAEDSAIKLDKQDVTDAADTSNINGYQLRDNGIAITFNLSTIKSGGSDSLTYYSSLDPNVQKSLDKLKKQLSLSIDCREESIAGFDGSGTYDITQNTSDKKWVLVIRDDKTYTLTDSEGKEIESGSYDDTTGIKFLEEWQGSKLTIQKRSVDDTTYEPSEVIIPSRPDTPKDPSAPNVDNSAPAEVQESDVTTTTNSIIVKGVRGQEYTIDDGKTWIKPDKNGLVSYTDLESGKIFTIKTRVAATKTSLCSEVSEGLEVQTRLMFLDVNESSYTGEFDGQLHEIKVETEVSDAQISYSTSLDGTYRSEPFSFSEIGTHVIYYKIVKEGYYTLYGKLTADITKIVYKAKVQNASKVYGDEDPEFSYKLTKGGETVEKDFNISLARKEGEASGRYEITGTYTPASDEADLYDVQFESGTLTITPKPVTIKWDSTKLVYNGKSQAPTATVEGVLEGDSCKPFISGWGKDANAAGESYTAYAYSVSNSNYQLTGNRTTEFTIEPKEAELDWSNTEVIYNGNTQAPSVTVGNLEEGDTCNVTSAVYKLETVDQVPLPASAAGIYIAKATALSNPNYKLSSDPTSMFTIKPKSFSSSATVSLEGDGLCYDSERKLYYYAWDGTYKEPSIKVVDKDNGKELLRDVDYTVTGDQSSDEIGTHKFYLQGKGNYGTGRMDRIYMTWSIEQSEIHPEITVEDWTYGQKANTPKVSGANITGEVSYIYYIDEECKHPTNAENGALKEGGVPENAGTYYVKALFAETENYKNAEAKTSFTITPKEITVIPDAGQSKVYGDKDPVFTYEADLIGDDTLDGSLSRKSGEKTGTYEITEGKLSNDNYIISVKKGVLFTINAKKLTSDMITVAPINYPYDGNEHKPSLRYKDTGIQVENAALTKDDVMVKGDTSAADYGVYEVRIIGQGNYTGSVTKKWCISSVQDVTVTYDGESHGVTILNSAEADGVSILFADEKGNYTSKEAPTAIEPGTYTYSYQMTIDEGEWGDPIVAEGQAVLTIEKIVLKPKIILPDSIVYGDDYAPELVNNDGNGKVTYMYKPKDASDEEYKDSIPTDAGEYTVRASVEETEHYTDAVVVEDYTIEKHALEAIDPEEVYYSKDDMETKIITLDESYRNLKGVKYAVQNISDDGGMLRNGSVCVSEDGMLSYQLSGTTTQDTTAEIKILITSMNYQDIVVTMTIHIDVTAPDGEITIAGKSWKTMLHDITFGLFYKESKDVMITATDSGIGLQSIKYHVAEKEMTEDELQEESNWTVYKPFRIQPNSSNIVYAKLTDKAGNASIINSNGVVVYTDSAQNTAEITYTRTTKKDLEAKVSLNENEIKNICNGDTVLTYDKDYKVDENGTITFAGQYLETLQASEKPYNLFISYKPLGKDYVENTDDKADRNDAPADTQIALHVIKEQGTVTNMEDISKEYDADPVNAPEFTTTNNRKLAEGAEDSAVTIEYKKVDEDDTEFRSEKPVDAGDYVVRVTVAADEDYLEAVDEQEFSILPKDITAKITVEDKIYDGTTAATASAEVSTGIEGQELRVLHVAAEFKDKNAGRNKKVTIDANDVEIEAANENTNVDNYNVLVSRGSGIKADIKVRPLEGISWGETELVYNAKPQAPVAEAQGVLDGDECGIVVDGQQTDTNAVSGVPAYTAEAVKTDNANYILPEDGLTCDYTIINAEQEVPDVTGQAETIYGKKDGTIKNLSADMEYRVSGEDTEFKAVKDAEMTFAPGIYEVRMAAKPNYNASEAVKVTIAEGRRLTITLPADPVGYEITSDVAEADWRENVSLALKVVKGYSKLDAFAVTAVDEEGHSVEVTANEDGTFTVNGIESDITVYVTGIADITAPTGEISVEKNVWNSFLSNITFGMFFKEIKDVTITAADDGSGVQGIEYYLSDVTLTRKQVEELAGEQWTKYNDTVSLAPQKKVVVYAKLTDKAGNISYISSDGMVFDSMKPVISGVNNENELYIEKQYPVQVTEENLDKVYVADSLEYTEEDAVEVKEGSFSLKCDSEKEQYIIAVDKAGNSSYLKVNFVSLDKLKKAAKDEVTKKAAAALEELDKLTDLTEEQRAEAVKEITQKQKTAESAIDNAEDRSAVADQKEITATDIVKAIDEEKKLDLANAKDKAADAIDKKAEEAKKAIDALTDLTEEEKTEAKAAVDKKAEEAKADIAKIEDPSKKSDVSVNKDSADKAVEAEVTTAENTDLGNAKDKAADAIDKKAEEAKKAIDALTDLTEEEKTEAKAAIDKKAEESKKALEEITDPAKKSDVSANKDSADKAVEEEVTTAQNTDLGNAKDKAADAIDKKAEEAKKAIDALTDLTEEEKTEAKDAIDKKAEESTKALEEITDPAKKSDVSANKDSADKAVEEEVTTAQNTDLGNAKDKAADAIDKKAEEAKKAIDALTDLTEEEKTEAKAAIDKKAEESKKVLEEITDPAKKSDVSVNKDSAEKAVEAEVTTAENTDLGNAKDKAADAIDKKAEEAMADVDALDHLTDEEKAAAKEEIRKQAEAAKESIAALDKKTDVKNTAADADENIVGKLDETKVSDYNKTKDDNAVGKADVTVSGTKQGPDTRYTLSLRIGNTEVEKITDVKDGEKVTFDKLPDGVYNLVVSDGTDQKTTLVSVINGKTSDIGMVTVGNQNTSVEVRINAPKVAVGGLETIFDTTVYKDNTKAVETVEHGDGKVDMRLTAENAEADNDIADTVAEQKKISRYMDFTVDMIVTDADGNSDVYKVTDAQKQILLAIPLKDEEKNRTGYELLRKHNDGENEIVEKLPELAGEEKTAPAKEGFYIENDVLYVWAQKFSVYALAYDEGSTAPTPTPSVEPSGEPSAAPTVEPSRIPTVAPSTEPSQTPSAAESAKPAKTTTNSAVTAVSKAQQEKNALALNAKLKVSQTESKINIGWGKVTGASGYDVYVQYCGQKFTVKSITQVKNGKKTSVVVTKVNGKKLDLKKNYKIYVQAYKMVNGQKVILGKTITAHIVGRKNYKYTNVKEVKLAQSKVTLAAGKTAVVKAKTVLVDKKKKPLSDAHAKELRYATSNKSVAVISSTGQIKALKKGTCTIYVYARNGYTKAVKVTVK